MKKNSLLIFIIAITLFLAFWFSYASANSITTSGFFTFDDLPCNTYVGGNGTADLVAYIGTDTSGSVVGDSSDRFETGTVWSYWSGFAGDGSSNQCESINLEPTIGQYGNNSYFIRFTTLQGIFDYQLYRTAGVWSYVPPVPPDTTSRIDSISISTSTNTVNLTGYWNATTTSGVYEQLEFYQINTILGQEDYFTVNATTSGAFNIDFDYRNVVTPYTGTTTQPITANTTFYANLYQKNDAYYNPFGEYDTRYSTLLDATTTTLIASTTDAFNISSSTISEYPEYECEITSLTGCFKNAIVWAFYPSQQTIGRYYALMELIQKKPPIGYFYITKNAISDLSASSTSAFSITIPKHLKDYIFSPIDTGIAGLIWVFFIFAFYKRLKHLQI